MNLFIAVIQGLRAVSSLGVQLDDLVAAFAEDADVLLSDQVVDFHIGSVHRTQGNGAVEHQLHIAGAAGFLGGKRNLLGNIAGGNQLLRPADVVVFHHHNLQIRTHPLIRLEQLLQAEDEVDDVLCNGVCRRCLRSKDDGNRSLGQPPVQNLKIFPDGVQCVHLLAFILVQAFDLDVVDGVFIHQNPLCSKLLCQTVLVVLLDLQQLLQHLFLCIFQQFLQLLGILLPPFPNQRADGVAQFPVAEHQPAPRRNSVGFIVKMLRVELVEGFQFAFL